jgi:protein pelota
VAHLCLITPSLTLTRAKIVVPLPRKGRRGDGAHSRAVDKFHEAMLQAILRHVDFGLVKALLVGSPGFAADELLAYVWAQAQRREDARALLPHRAKVVRCHASSGFKHSIRDVLSDPATAAQLATTRAATEVAALDVFVATLGRDLGRAVYGFAHVRAACDHGALATLLISDELFRAQAVGARLRYVALVEEAKAAGAVVHIFSAMHISGEQLAKLGGVAATLRFPLADELLDEAAAARGDGASAALAAAFAAGEAALEAAGGEMSSDDDGEGPLALPADGIFDGEAYDPFR